MPPENTKRTALIAEGLTEAEADYLMSGGTKTDGLDLPADNSSSSTTVVEPVRDIDESPAPAQGQPQPQPQPQAADADDEPDPKSPVPYQRYSRDKQNLRAQLKERDDRLAAISGELGSEREKWTRLDERLRLFREAAEQPDPAAAAQPKPKPDREADPFGYMAWMEEQLQQVSSKVEQSTAQLQERDAAVELTNTFRNDAAQYARTNPEFWESQQGARDGAYHYLMKSRDQELHAAGYADPNERLRIIAADERDIVARAFHARQRNPSAPSPSEILFNLAVSRGYQKRVAPAPQPGNGAAAPPAANGAGNGLARPGNGAAPPSPATVTDQIASIQRGQAASRSLSSAGGAPPPQGIDLASLANMDDNEYAAWLRGLTAAQKKEYYSLIGAR